MPNLAIPEIQRGYLLPDRSIRVDVLLKRLADLAAGAGAEIRPLTRIKRLLRIRHEVHGIVTSLGEEVTGRLVILAANTRSAELLPELAAGEHAGYRVLPFKTHLIAAEVGPASWPICVPDADGFNHLPHPPRSVFGTNRWLPTQGPADDSASPEEFELIREQVARTFPESAAAVYEAAAWAGTTLQAVATAAPVPATPALPLVIDHARDTPSVDGIVTILPGRATLWSSLAEHTEAVVREKLGAVATEIARPPWLTPEPGTAAPRVQSETIDLYHCQKCGRVQRRERALQPPICCDTVMVRVAREVVR